MDHESIPELNIFVGNQIPKKVTTDDPQLRIANSQTYSDRGINDNIIFAPNWAAVQGTPTVHYATSLSSRNGY